MTRFLHKIASLFMAVIVLLSTMSFTIEKHYCGDYLVDISILGNLEKCDMKSEQAAVLKKKDCCSDEILHVEGQDELQKENFNTLPIYQKLFLTDVFFKKLAFLDSKEGLSARNSGPPDLHQCKNLQIFYQTFLI